MSESKKQRIAYLATHNAHKVEEFQAIAGNVWKILPLSALEAPITWEETGHTFADNARIKALAVKKQTNHCVIADDSGLEVKALNNEPGVYSSRYAGEDGNDAKNNAKLMLELSKINSKDRSASFVCCLVFIDENNQESIFFGRCQGSIINEARGQNGFGYDPLFVPDGYEKTLAELPADIKNSISHRKKAIAQWLEHIG